VENKVTNRQTVDRRQTQLATKTEAVVVSNALIATNTQVMWQKIVQKKGKSRCHQAKQKKRKPACLLEWLMGYAPMTHGWDTIDDSHTKENHEDENESDGTYELIGVSVEIIENENTENNATMMHETKNWCTHMMSFLLCILNPKYG
jgi:hypothetical protein